MVIEKALKKSKDIVFREIEGEVILVPLFRQDDEIECFYTLNEPSVFAWKNIDGKKTFSEIKNTLLKEFEIKEDELEKDLKELIEDLKNIKALV